MFMGGAIPMLSIGSFIQHELQRSGRQADAFRVEADEAPTAGEGTVRVRLASGGALELRFWKAPDERIILSASTSSGSHSVRAVARTELVDSLAGIVQRWLRDLA